MSNFATKSVSEIRFEAAKKWADIHSPSGGRRWWVVLPPQPGCKPKIVDARGPGRGYFL